MSPNTPYRIAITAQEFEALLAQIPSKIDSSYLRTSLANSDDTSIPTTLAVKNALSVISGDFSSLGELSYLDSVSLETPEVTGTLPITKGGSGSSTLSGAQYNLGILTQSQIESLIGLRTTDLTNNNTAWQKSFTVSSLTSFELLVTFSSMSHSAHKKVICHVGSNTGEFYEVLESKVDPEGGEIDLVPTWTGTEWNVVVNRPSGATASNGRTNMVITCATGVTLTP